MEYRLLGKTGLNVSRLGIGSWQLSGPLQVNGQPDGFPDIGTTSAIKLIHFCGDLGINLIDTAEIYGDGEGERRIGQALQGQRDQWVISSKFGLRVNNQGQRVINSSPATIRPSLEGSLKRLQTDYIDIYLYHCPPQPQHLSAAEEVLETLKHEGKIRHYGISSDNFSEVKSVLGMKSADVILTGQSLIQAPTAILNLVAQRKLGMMTRGVFAGGLLSGQYFQAAPSFQSQDFRYGLNMRWHQYAGYEKIIPEEMSMPEFALRYVLDQPLTQTIILGSRYPQQYQMALQTLEQPSLSSQTLQDIRRFNQKHQLKNLPRRILRKFGVSLAY